MRWRRLVHTNRLVETTQDDVTSLHHKILANGATGIRETLLEAGTGGVQEQARRLDGITADDDNSGVLLMLVFVLIEIAHTVGQTVLVEIDACDHAARADLRAMPDGIRYMTDERALLGTDLTPLDAEATIDAMRTITERASIDGDGTARHHGNAESGTASHEHIPNATQWMLAV